MDLVAGLKDRCNKYHTLEWLRKRITAMQDMYKDTGREALQTDIKESRFALAVALDMLIEIGVITKAEREVVMNYYGCYDRA